VSRPGGTGGVVGWIEPDESVDVGMARACISTTLTKLAFTEPGVMPASFEVFGEIAS